MVSTAVVFATIVVTMTIFERSMIYYPTRFPDGQWDTEAVARGTGCVIEDCFFEAEDGVRLHGWLCRRVRTAEDEGGGDDMSLLWFHGNAGNLSHRAEMLLRLTTLLPADVMIVGYRGYGRSEGRPSEAGLYRDARAAWRYLREERGREAGDIVIFGKSLGGAMAVDLAMQVEPAGLIIESSFTSVPAMAGHHFPLVPRFLVRTRMDSLAKIRTVACPKLFVHSRADEVVPFALGRELYEAAPEPKRFFEVMGAGHNETWLVGGKAYFAALGQFVSDCRH
ncbi:MAG: alpha/beta hydrolase [Acidobacteria bacterium]|nr:alpha/beta hydrolase [Acidobacteriota bacterium]